MEGSLFLARPIKITMSGIEIKKEKSNERKERRWEKEKRKMAAAWGLM